MNIAVVTGASSGLGKEFAKQLDKRRLDEIWLIARRKDNLEKISKSLKTKTRIIPVDLLNKDSFFQYQIMLRLVKPKVRYLVNAAGQGKFGDYKEISLEESCEMIDLNVKATVKMTITTIPFMPMGSHIIQMCSSSSFNALPYFNIYASTKAFIKHYAIALRKELKPTGITVTAVCPGWVNTEFFKHTKQNQTIHSPKKYKPIASPSSVVKKAIYDAQSGKALSVFGIYSKTQYIAAKLLPECFIIKLWKNMLK